MDKDLVQTVPIPMSVIVSKNNGRPMIELRKTITDLDLIKLVISCGYKEKGLVFVPTFSSRLRSINSLIEKGFIYHEDGKYYFTF